MSIVLLTLTVDCAPFDAMPDPPFSVDIDPPLSSGSDSVRELARERSRATYARPRPVVEREIAETYEAFKQAAPEDQESKTDSARKELDRLL